MQQEELVSIYKKLKPILKKYEGKLIPKFDTDDKYDLWSIKDIEIEGRKRKEIYFAGLIIQSSYVGFYFMPVYSHDEAKKYIPADLLKMLNGKSCFHIKKVDEGILKDIESSLEKGYVLYREKGWI